MSKLITLGPLIEGTMRPIDTIPAMLREAQRRGLDWKSILEDSHGQFREEDTLGAGLKFDDFTPFPKAPYWNNVIGLDGGWTSDEDATHTVGELIDLLNEDLAGATFGTHPDDPACLGYWSHPNEDARGDGIHFEWNRMRPGIGLRMKGNTGREDVFMQDDDMYRFQLDIGAVDFIWMNDPSNKEGRVFKTIEEHYDAIMDPYFNND